MLKEKNNNRLQSSAKALLTGSVAMLFLIFLQGPERFTSWITGSFLLYVASFFFLWPVARIITGQQFLKVQSFLNIGLGIIAWILYASINDLTLLLLLESFLTIIFVVGLLYSSFAIGEMKIWAKIVKKE